MMVPVHNVHNDWNWSKILTKFMLIVAIEIIILTISNTASDFQY